MINKDNKVANVIKDNYKKWNKGDSILIGAGMGTGKTTFVFDVLVPYAKANNKKILFVSNRTALRQEIDLQIIKQNISNDIISITYQTLEKYILNIAESEIENINNNEKLDELQQYNYIVCDECHYFLNDSWTKQTDVSYYYLLNNQNAIKIYMSATYVNIKNLLKDDLAEQGKQLKEYILPFDFSDIEQIVFYKDDDYINRLINTINENEKLIYFSRKIDNIFILHNCYKDNSSFVCSKKGKKGKNLKYINAITSDAIDENGILKNQLTFVTSVWDNGINILDNDVVHVVIDIDEIVTFIQCIGRRRKNINRFTLHIRNWNKKSLTQFINPKIAQRNLTDEYINNPEVSYNKNKIGELKLSECMYIDTITEQIKINMLMYKNIKQIIRRYKYMKKIGFDEYINLFLQNKNIKYDNFEIKQKENEVYTLEEYLKAICGKHLINMDMKKELKQAIGLIDKKHNRLVASIQTLNSYLLNDLKLNYQIQEIDIYINKKRYKHTWQVICI